MSKVGGGRSTFHTLASRKRMIVRHSVRPILVSLPIPILSASGSKRAFSLWNSPSPPPSPPPPPPPSAPPPPTEVIEPLTSALPIELAPLTYSPSFFDPLATFLLSLPTPPGPLLFIPLLTILLRTTITLPTILWARKRIQTFENVAMPLVKLEQQKMALDLRDEFRKKGQSYDAYKKEFNKRAKKIVSTISSAKSCHPYPTLFAPPLIQIPLLIGSTLAVRQACELSLYSTPTWALEPFFWCESLVLADPTMALPLAVSVVMLLNVEVGQENRRKIQEARDAAAGIVDENSMGGSTPKPSTSNSTSKLGNRGFTTSSTVNADLSRAEKTKARKEENVQAQKAEAQEKKLVKQAEKAEKGKGVTLVLRFASIAFIPIASFAPAAVCIYWLSSNLYTLAQNLVLNSLDRRRRIELVKENGRMKTTAS